MIFMQTARYSLTAANIVKIYKILTLEPPKLLDRLTKNIYILWYRLI